GPIAVRLFQSADHQLFFGVADRFGRDERSWGLHAGAARIILADLRGQVAQGDGVAPGQHDGAFDGGVKFADIAGPTVSGQGLQGVRSYAFDFFAVGTGAFANERLDQ